MRTAKDVQQYLEGVDYPVGPPELHVAATQNGAPPDFVELLGLLPTAAVFYDSSEVAAQLERMNGLGLHWSMTGSSIRPSARKGRIR